MKNLTQIKIDQLRFNLPFKNDWQDNISLLIPNIFDLGKPVETKGMNGYTEGLVYGLNINAPVRIMVNKNRPDMGILVDISASAKLMLETRTTNRELDWFSIIRNIYLLNGHLSRIDIAIDLIDSDFSINKIVEGLKDHTLFFLNSRKQRIIDKRFKFFSDLTGVQTINVGSRSSDAFLRIYNKRMEQLRKQGDFLYIAKNCDSWVRVEGEFKHRLAKRIGQGIAEHDCTSAKLAGMITKRWYLVTEKVYETYKVVDGLYIAQPWQIIEDLSESMLLPLQQTILTPFF